MSQTLQTGLLPPSNRANLSLAPSSLEQELSHLLCTLDGTLLGIEALRVREVLPLPLVTPLREAAPLIAGVVNVRGILVPVIDLRGALGFPDRAPQLSDVLLVLSRGDEFIAFSVGAVRDVESLALFSSDTLTGQAAAPPEGGFIMAVAPLRDQIVQVLRLDSLFELAKAAPQTVFSSLAWPEITSPEMALFERRAQLLIGEAANGPSGEESASEARSLAAFALGGELFGLDVGVVREFCPLRSVAHVPCSPPFIAGLMNLRGETLTLIDIRDALGLPSASPLASTARVIVTQCDGVRVGIIVDEVLDILSVRPSEIAPSPGAEATSQRGTVFFGDKMLSVLDLSRLLQSEALTP